MMATWICLCGHFYKAKGVEITQTPCWTMAALFMYIALVITYSVQTNQLVVL